MAQENNDIYKEKCYSGHLKNQGTLMLSSSGGFVYALCESFLSSDGVVYGVTFDDDYMGASWIRITVPEDLRYIQGTKYIKSNLKMKNSNVSVYDSVIHDISMGHKVMFCGLPCEVGGLRARIKTLTTDNLLCVDLICQGTGQLKVYNDFIGNLKRKYKSEISSIIMRFKNPDWVHPYMRIQFVNGKIYQEPLQNTSFWSGIVNVPMKSCTMCRFKGDGHLSDITCGDHWGVDASSSTYDINGTSIAITHTVLGEKAIQKLSNVSIEEVCVNDALVHNPRYYKSVVVDEYKLRYQRIYNKKGLEYAHKHRFSPKQRLKMMLPKTIIQRLEK